MYTLPVKKWFHHIHMPSRHDMALKAEHIVHDERFWPIVIAIALMTIFVGLVVLAGLTLESNPDAIPESFFPYGF